MSEEDKVVTTATGEVPTPEKQAETATQMPEEELPLSRGSRRWKAAKRRSPALRGRRSTG